MEKASARLLLLSSMFSQSTSMIFSVSLLGYSFVYYLLYDVLGLSVFWELMLVNTFLQQELRQSVFDVPQCPAVADLLPFCFLTIHLTWGRFLAL